MSSKIYTKKGDKGKTQIMSRNKISKSSPVIEVIGSVDEVNSYIGMVIFLLRKTFGKTKTVKHIGMNMATTTISYSQLENDILTIVKHCELVQNVLFTLGAYLASSGKNVVFTDHTEKLEKNMDKMSETLEPLKNFILPGGSELVSYCHITRSVCRKAERNLVNYLESDECDVDLKNALKFVNRLSDYLFVLARYCCEKEGCDEIIWKCNK